MTTDDRDAPALDDNPWLEYGGATPEGELTTVGGRREATTNPLPPPGPTRPAPAPSTDPSPAPQPPPSELQPEPTAELPPGVIRAVKIARPSVEGATAKARERLERQQTLDTRSFGGRRTGLVRDQEELARLAALDAHLLELARRAIRKDTPSDL